MIFDMEAQSKIHIGKQKFNETNDYGSHKNKSQCYFIVFSKE